MAMAFSRDPLAYWCTGGASLRRNIWLATGRELELGSSESSCDAVALDDRGSNADDIAATGVFVVAVCGLAALLVPAGSAAGCGSLAVSGSGRVDFVPPVAFEAKVGRGPAEVCLCPAPVARPWSRRPAERTPGRRPPASLRVAAEIFGAIAALVGRRVGWEGGLGCEPAVLGLSLIHI